MTRRWQLGRQRYIALFFVLYLKVAKWNLVSSHNEMPIMYKVYWFTRRNQKKIVIRTMILQSHSRFIDFHYDMVYFSLYFLLEKVQKLSLQIFTRRNIVICLNCIISRLQHPNFDNFYSVMRECRYYQLPGQGTLIHNPTKTRYWSTWFFLWLVEIIL